MTKKKKIVIATISVISLVIVALIIWGAEFISVDDNEVVYYHDYKPFNYYSLEELNSIIGKKAYLNEGQTIYIFAGDNFQLSSGRMGSMKKKIGKQRAKYYIGTISYENIYKCEDGTQIQVRGTCYGKINNEFFVDNRYWEYLDDVLIDGINCSFAYAERENAYGLSYNKQYTVYFEISEISYEFYIDSGSSRMELDKVISIVECALNNRFIIKN